MAGNDSDECRFRMPEESTLKESAYQIINDELMLDGNPRLNLASFIPTWMEPECDKLIMSAINKNYVDMDECPVTTKLQACPSSSSILFNGCTAGRFSSVGSGQKITILFLIVMVHAILQKHSAECKCILQQKLHFTELQCRNAFLHSAAQMHSAECIIIIIIIM
ncbi:Glutamate decarboxylase 1 [Senna tora]|uniref:Glutamate decarboxylase 1 n=1 Tax=Senna tora TaxID=362788 RepID=A0A834XER2_9FABA|nr:Glutamate decarboxylase 1 [Senna tora]